MPKNHVQKSVLLFDKSMFGRYKHKKVLEKADISSEVVGLIADPSDPKSPSAIAILTNTQGESKVYQIGSKLPGEYELIQIFPQKIILMNRQGVRYYLGFLKPNLE
jgi:hypothetical protein